MLIALLFVAIAGLQTAAVTARRDAQAPTGSSAISGRIADETSGTPLPRIVVSLAATDQSTTLQAITDADGRYHFTGLEAGKYVLSAAPGTHRLTYLPRRYGETGPAAAAPSQPNIVLKAGERRSGVDIVLSRALAIEGRVFDAWGEPMAEVEVVASRIDVRTVAAWPVASDDLGVYRVYGLVPGRYRVCVNARGRSDVPADDGATFVRTCHPSAVIEHEAGDVILTSYDATGIDIRVQRAASYSIAGSVTDTAGAAVDGARVGAYSLDDSGISATATSRGGAFVLKGLTPGRYVITAVVGGSPRGDPLPPRQEMEAGHGLADVGSGDVTGIAVTLSKPATIAGQVTFDGAPAPSANRLRLVVQTRPSDHRVSRLDSRPPFAAVDDNLRFELKGIYRLPLAVGIQGMPEGWVLKAVRYGERDITDVATDFGSSSSSRLEIVLTNRVARPSIRVTDEQGTPVASYRVVGVPADPSRWRLALGRIVGTPAADGVLKLGAILPGDYFLAALPPDDFSMLFRDADRVDGLATIGTRVRLVEGDDRTVDLRLVNLPPAR